VKNDYPTFFGLSSSKLAVAGLEVKQCKVASREEAEARFILAQEMECRARVVDHGVTYGRRRSDVRVHHFGS